jgi:hypothetical protein
VCLTLTYHIDSFLSCQTSAAKNERCAVNATVGNDKGANTATPGMFTRRAGGYLGLVHIGGPLGTTSSITCIASS